MAFPPDYDEHANPPVEVGGNTPYYRKIAGQFLLFLPNSQDHLCELRLKKDREQIH